MSKDRTKFVVFDKEKVYKIDIKDGENSFHADVIMSLNSSQC